MNLRSCLLLVLLACSKKQESEVGSVCRVEEYFLAQDASGKALDIAEARGAARLPGRPLNRPTHLTFRRGGRITVDWDVYDFGWIKELEYDPGSPKANIIDLLDGGVIGAYPIRVEGSPPKSVTLEFPTKICSFNSEPQTCGDMTEEKRVFSTYTCQEERL